MATAAMDPTVEVEPVVLSRYGKAAAAAAREYPAGTRGEEELRRVARLGKARGGFLCSFSPEVLAEICQRFAYQAVPAGVQLFTEGEPSDNIYLVATGRLRLRQRQGSPRGDADEDAELPHKSEHGKLPVRRTLTWNRHPVATDPEAAGQDDAHKESTPRRWSNPASAAFFAKILAMRALAAKRRIAVNNAGQSANREEEPPMAVQHSVSSTSLPAGPPEDIPTGAVSAGESPISGPVKPEALRDYSRLSVPLAKLVRQMAEQMAEGQGVVSRGPGAPLIRGSLIIGGATVQPDESFGSAFAKFCKSIGVHDPDDHVASGAVGKGRPVSTAIAARARRPQEQGPVEAEKEASSSAEGDTSSSSSSEGPVDKHPFVTEQKSQIFGYLEEAADADHNEYTVGREARPGQFVGVKACLSEQPYYFTVSTAERCELLVLSSQALRECTEMERGQQRAKRENVLLKAVHSLRALERDKFERLAECFRSNRHRRGTVLCCEGEVRVPYSEGDRLLILMEGQARSVKNWPDQPLRPGQPLPPMLDVGALLPGQVVNGASQLLGTPEPLTVIIESAEAVVISAARSELSRVAGSSVLEDLRATAEAIGRWHAQRLQALEGGSKGKRRRPAASARPAGAKAQAGAPVPVVPNELMHEVRSALDAKKVMSSRRNPPTGVAGAADAEAGARRPASPGGSRGDGEVAATAPTLPGGLLALRRPRRLLSTVAASEVSQLTGIEERSSAPSIASRTGAGGSPGSARGKQGEQPEGRRRCRPSIADVILWPEAPSCDPSGCATASALLEGTMSLADHLAGEDGEADSEADDEEEIGASVSLTKSFNAANRSGRWDGLPPSLLGPAIGQLTSLRTELNESMTPWHLERLEMRGDKAVLVPLGPIDPFTIETLGPSQEESSASRLAALLQPRPEPTTPPGAAGRRRLRPRPQPVQRRPWLPSLVGPEPASEDEGSQSRTASGAGSHGSPLPQVEALDQTLLPASHVSASSGSGGRKSPASPPRVLLEEPPVPMLAQLQGLGEVFSRVRDLHQSVRGGLDSPLLSRDGVDLRRATRSVRLEDLLAEPSIGSASTMPSRALSIGSASASSKADEQSIWDQLYSVFSSSGVGDSCYSLSDLRRGSSSRTPARHGRAARAAGQGGPRRQGTSPSWVNRPPPLTARAAAPPGRPGTKPQRLQCLAPVEEPVGKLSLRQAAPLRVGGIGHWLDTGPRSAR